MSRKKEYEALVFVLDIGPNMNETVPGETSTFFEQSVKCIEWILQRKIFSESKDELGLVLLGTRDTSNHLADDACTQYQNITEAIELVPASWDFLRKVKQLKVSALSADFVDGLVVASDMLFRLTEEKPAVSARKIVFLSNFGGQCNPDESDSIIKGLRNLNVNLTVIGVDLENLNTNGDHYKESRRLKALKVAKHITEGMDGDSYSFSSAIPQLMFYQTKEQRSVPWNINLEIGPDLKIPVSSYLKIKEFAPKPLKSCYARDISAHLTTETTYHKNDEAQTEVEKEDIVSAFKYGSTLVPFNDADRENMKYKGSEKCLSLLGFTSQDNIKIPYYSGTGSRLIVAKKDDETAAVALSALINALYETESVAIVRYCYSSRSNPRMGFLSPVIKSKYEALAFILLPFMEDVRRFTFPSLSKQATDEQLNAIDDLITTMTLSSDDGEEMLKSSSILNPSVQRKYQCFAHRVANPDGLLPKVEERFLEKLEPPVEVVKACKPVIERINRLFPLKVVEKKKKKRDGFADLDDVAEVSDPKRARTDSDGGIASLIQGPITSIGTATPVEDFKTLLKEKEKTAETLCRELQTVITELVTKSFGAAFYGKALECVKVLREEACKVAVDRFNEFLRDIKTTFGSKGRIEFWHKLRDENITLISTNENAVSRVTPDEAEDFLKDEQQVVPVETTVEDDADDLLDMI